MYFLTGFPEQLRLPCSERVVGISTDGRDRLLTAVLTSSSLYILAFIRGQSALLGVYSRSRESLEQHGPNIAVLWRPPQGDGSERQLALLVSYCDALHMFLLSIHLPFFSLVVCTFFHLPVEEQ
jgi:hypothetical protein